MKEIRVAFMGFGNVGKALARLILNKQDELADRYGIQLTSTGIFTATHGGAIDYAGLNLLKVLSSSNYEYLSKISFSNSKEFILNSGADVLFENSPVNYLSGQPALDHLRWALELGMHGITANKGPVVHGHQELTEIAQRSGKKFLFESTVMDGSPIFSLFREALPGANLISFRGVLNSTTNMILTLMEQGDSFDQAVLHCQEIGIAETDPSGDIDGWDAAVKVAALTSVLMKYPLKPAEVDRTGIRAISKNAVDSAFQEGKRWKLVCTAKRYSDHVVAKVAPELISPESPLFGVNGTTSIIQFETDVLGLLSILEEDPGPHTTAYGLLADLINAVRD